MAWFSPIKGAYPGLTQIDNTRPVDSRAVGIVRGSVVYVTDADAFALAGAAQAVDPSAYVYFTLTGQDDFQAGMAGTVGYGGATVDGAVPGVARISALAVGMPIEFQTDQFDARATYHVNDYLTVGNGVRDNDDTGPVDGLLVPHTAGDNVIAQVTKVPFTRWINNADVLTAKGRRTGANVLVIQARTVWIPQYTVGS